MQTQNLNRTKLNSEKIGIVFGEFAPFHKGHLSLVHQALMENDAVVVVVSGSSKPSDRGESIDLPLSRRFRYLRETFNDEESVRIVMIDETSIPDYPNGWNLWIKELRQQIAKTLTDQNEANHEFVIYTGESEYINEFESRLPNFWKVKFVNRKMVPISATEIRNNPLKHWDYIVPQFRRHFVKKVLVIGSASTGKSTLIRRLAKQFESPYSEEFARTYEEEFNVDDNELTENDYIRFINGQFELNAKAIDAPHSHGIALLDTDAIVTKVYAKMYLPNKAMDTLGPLFDYTIAREEIDMILVIPPITKYVDDGFRAMDWADSRYDFHKNLMYELELNNLTNKVIMLDQTDINGGFYSRYLTAENAIQNLISK